MDNRPAINASPLIFLAHSGYLDLLKLVGDEIIVPEAVATEILRRGSQDPTASAIAETAWLKVTSVSPAPSIILGWDLGSGETDVLTWVYQHKDSEAIIDDLAARRCAKTLNIPFTGTLGLVLRAKRKGIISAARPVVDKLRQSGMYLSDQVITQALQLVDE